MKTKNILFAVCSSLALGSAVFSIGCDDTTTTTDMAVVTRDMAMVVATPDMTVVQMNVTPDLGCYGPPSPTSTAYQIINACPSWGDPSGVAANPALPLLPDSGVLPALP